MARPRAPDYDEKRATLLRKAASVFARRGFAGASIQLIAQAAGVSKSLLYHYWRDKEALLFDVIATHLRHLLEVVESAAETLPAGRERLDAMSVALLEAYRGADDQHQVQIGNLRELSRPQQDELRGVQQSLVALFAESLALAAPHLAERPGLLTPMTMSLFGLLNWNYLWFRDGGALTREGYARMATELVVSGSVRLEDPAP